MQQNTASYGVQQQYQHMQPEHLAYWLERAKAELAERDVLIQNQRNEIERLTRSLQEVNYNACMQTSIIAYEVQRFAREKSRVLVPSNPHHNSAAGASSSVPVVKLSDLESFLSELTGGILSPSPLSSDDTHTVPPQSQEGSDRLTSSSTTGGVGVVSAPSSNNNGASSSSSNERGQTTSMTCSASADIATAAVAASAASLTRLQQMRLRFSSKRCRDEVGYDDGRPLKPGQWFILPAPQEQDV